MSYVISLTEGDAVRYIKARRGWDCPLVTDNKLQALKFALVGEANDVMFAEREKIVKKFPRVELAIEEVRDEPNGAAKEYVPTGTEPKPYYLEEYGNPRGKFEFGKDICIPMYMRKDENGEIEYMFISDKGKVAGNNAQEIITAMCKHALTRVMKKIEEFNSKKEKKQ